MEHIQTKLPDDIIRNTTGLKIKKEKKEMVNAEHFYLSIHSAHCYLNEADKVSQNVSLFCNFDFNMTRATVGL